MRRKQRSEAQQLDLFETLEHPAHEEIKTIKEPTVLDFIRARFENGPEMTQEEYKRWIKVLVNSSLKRMS